MNNFFKVGQWLTKGGRFSELLKEDHEVYEVSVGFMKYLKFYVVLSYFNVFYGWDYEDFVNY